MAFDGDEKRESRIAGPRELVLKGALRRSAERIETKTEKQTSFSVLSMFSRAGWLRQGEGGWHCDAVSCYFQLPLKPWGLSLIDSVLSCSAIVIIAAEISTF